MWCILVQFQLVTQCWSAWVVSQNLYKLHTPIILHYTLPPVDTLSKITHLWECYPSVAFHHFLQAHQETQGLWAQHHPLWLNTEILTVKSQVVQIGTTKSHTLAVNTIRMCVQPASLFPVYTWLCDHHSSNTVVTSWCQNNLHSSLHHWGTDVNSSQQCHHYNSKTAALLPLQTEDTPWYSAAATDRPRRLSWLAASLPWALADCPH